jgi:hypothetical protein
MMAHWQSARLLSERLLVCSQTGQNDMSQGGVSLECASEGKFNNKLFTFYRDVLKL